MGEPHYETERLRLRNWMDSDREPFAALNADPRVMTYFRSVYTREESDNMIDMCAEAIEKTGFSFWAAERKDSGEFIGFVGINRFNRDLPFCPCVEIGWRLAHAYWGYGFASEAAKECLRAGFMDFDIDEIVAFATLGNTRSRAVMSRIGMKDTGTVFDHPNVPVETGLQPHCLYRLAKEAWEDLAV